MSTPLAWKIKVCRTEFVTAQIMLYIINRLQFGCIHRPSDSPSQVHYLWTEKGDFAFFAISWNREPHWFQIDRYIKISLASFSFGFERYQISYLNLLEKKCTNIMEWNEKSSSELHYYNINTTMKWVFFNDMSIL